MATHTVTTPRQVLSALLILTATLAPGAARAQNAARPAPAAAAVVTPPPGYVIGAEDVLTVAFWRDREMSGDVIVRPDGKISLPLINEIEAAGLTPDELRVKLMDAAKRFLEDPNATVVVKAINSRKVFITGEVAKPGAYQLQGPTSVIQLIAMAGGLHEYADSSNIVVIRKENGRETSFRVNYKDVTKRKNLKQNIELRPGDTVIVP